MSLYSELMGSFIRNGSFPLEANYIFKTVSDLNEFYKDPVNATTLHKGLLRLVELDDTGKQSLYWVVEKENSLQFEKLTDTLNSVGNNVKASYIDNHLVIEIDGVKVVDSEIQSNTLYDKFLSASYNPETESIDLTFENGLIIAIPLTSIISNKTGNAIRNNEGLYVSTAAATGQIGIPVVTNTMVGELGESLPADHIVIPDSETDLLRTPTLGTVSKDGSYVEILFSAIRKLQAEVSRLKNSFEYGIYSYTGENTAMSAQVAGITEDESEPLWAIDEEDLSEIRSITIGPGNGLIPAGNVDTSISGILKITDLATWEDDGSIASAEDAKVFAFITTNNLDYTVVLSTAEGATFKIDLAKLTSNISKLNAYNTMICVSRATSENGKQYVYVSIGSGTRDKILLEKYITSDFKLVDKESPIGNDYYFSKIEFQSLNLTKLNFYSKYYDFSHEVIPSIPESEDLMYKTAHITIRSVKNYAVLLKIQLELPNNELIFVEDTKKLYIKSNNALVNIGASGGGSDTPEPGDIGMDTNEIIDLLAKNGIVISEEGGQLALNDLSEITFVHEETGKKFKFTIDENGTLTSREVIDDSLKLENRLKAAGLDTVDFSAKGDSIKWGGRGFVANLLMAEYNTANPTSSLDVTKDAKLRADRIKIGAVYAPLSTSVAYGCTRAFVELENTSDKDMMLDGCYLHFATYDLFKQRIVKHLPLKGVIKAGSTFVIAGKRYAQDTDANAFIKVTSYDQEWYDGDKLIDFTMDDTEEGADANITRVYSYAFALTYDNPNLETTTALTANMTLEGYDQSKFPYMYHPCFIDALSFNTLKEIAWTPVNAVVLTKNSMYKNTFELDPAKQAFLATNTTDSSRNRWAKSTTDYWIVDLSEEYISFPQSSEKYPISKFTPKASFDNKNVCTDKTKLQIGKPNAIVCSFGVDALHDRTFNWISAGVFDEYVFIRRKGGETWDSIIESFNDSKDFKQEGDWQRKTYTEALLTAAYKRIIRRFPADNTLYTSHKCIIHLTKDEEEAPVTFEYVVGQKDKNNNPIYCSEVRTFTVYPKTYTPRIYQITDQLGFHWLEYQAWAAAANALDAKIKKDMESEHIYPVIINTGDVTLNGTRVNEWLDYFNAGDVLFSKYEQLNIVGNNDLCGTDPDVLGTGDDVGKSNGYFFHLFNCSDIDEKTFTPIINGVYIPSLYYVDTPKHRFVLINTEITMINCRDWFKLGKEDGEVTNIYTGFDIKSRKYNSGFNSIYTMLFKMLTTDKECIPACHEMPFTVVTLDNMQKSTITSDRSKNGKSLVGSHCNRIDASETGLMTNGAYNGIYWLSRLFEFKKVKLCIGGHKHTYACTYPLREFFYFDPVIDGNKVTSWNKNSKDNYSEFTMEETLENDLIGWVNGGKDTTKFPLTKRKDAGSPAVESVFYPYTPAPELEGGVVYFMCLATGYKLASNKELPGPALKFSMIIPKTKVGNSGGTAKPDTELQYPMFGIIKLGNNIEVEIARVTNVMVSGQFTQSTYSSAPMTLLYLLFTPAESGYDDNYGKWLSPGKKPGDTSDKHYDEFTLITI